MKKERLYITWMIDCEATQPAVGNKTLGERSSLGFARIVERFGLPGTFHVLPSEIEASPKLYRRLCDRGHEIGLHLHPAADGFEEFLGVYGPDEQQKIIAQAADRLRAAAGFEPGSVCIGYFSTNDHTYGVLHDLGFRHGTTSIPSRVLPECASVHAGAPLDVHFAHRYNRVLVGDLDYVEVPCTVDPDSRMWGGKHPQDLRVELVDAKNHYYTIKKAIERQVAQNAPVKHIRGITHNVFEYGDPKDFRTQTLEATLEHARTLAKEAGLELVGVTTAELAAIYRRTVGRGTGAVRLTLDRRAHGGAAATRKQQIWKTRA